MAGTPLSDHWDRGDIYDSYVGRWSRQVAPVFVSWLGEPAGRKWLDVGCGTGALCGAILEQASPASVTGVEPSAGFLKTAKEHLGTLATLHQGSATAIPLNDASVDVVVSGLVLNFVPDQKAALAEMKRVVAKGGTIAAYVWDYGGKMEFMRYFWDAAVAVDPAARAKAEGIRFPICRAGALEQFLEDAGLRSVEARAIDIPTAFKDFDDYWRPFLGGQGPAPAYAMSLDEPARQRLRDHLLWKLPIAADGTIPLIARAWAARATVS